MDIEPDWIWLIGGLVLLIAEIVAPGVFLVFIGAAAIVTGLFVAALSLGTPAALTLFAIYTALGLFVGRRFYARAGTPSSDSLLNDRAGRLVGKRVIVTQAIDEQGGRVKIGDSEWSARGAPAPVGSQVRILGTQGNCLEVIPDPALPDTPSSLT